MVYDHAKLDDSKEGKRYKKKRKQPHSRTEDPTEDPADSGSPAIVAGIFAGILMLLLIFTGVPRLWRICKKRWQRRNDPESGLNIPPTAYFSEELSEEEIIFDRSTMGHRRKNESSKSASPRSTPNTSAPRPSYESTDHATREQKTWTLTDTPGTKILMLLFSFSGVHRLWRICKERWRRYNDREFGLNIPATAYFSDELSEEEIIFDRTAMEHKKESTKSAEHAIHEQKHGH
ncbi:hypothetical protein OS493_009656 [Desmophyllum pertusum]|uniref:Uncharacterized protein n=1 Tax=Desmophyllum pertusum TaxID=174260 RepID=A0A9X0CLX9_9CNID|nr:hypothetical protein OS493_009656 [Desmophyllum pertusum]